MFVYPPEPLQSLLWQILVLKRWLFPIIFSFFFHPPPIYYELIFNLGLRFILDLRAVYIQRDCFLFKLVIQRTSKIFCGSKVNLLLMVGVLILFNIYLKQCIPPLEPGGEIFLLQAHWLYRITRWFRLEGLSGGHPAQLSAQNRVCKEVRWGFSGLYPVASWKLLGGEVVTSQRVCFIAWPSSLQISFCYLQPERFLLELEPIFSSSLPTYTIVKKQAPPSLTCWEAEIKSLQSHLFPKPNKPKFHSFSLQALFQPPITLVAFHWTHSNLSISFWYLVAKTK